jgi:hypothetical protein
LEESSKLFSSILESCPTELQYVVDMGQLLLRRYQLSGCFQDLDDSLVLLHRAHGLRVGHPARGRICRLIAAAMILRDQHFGSRLDFCLRDQIENFKELLLWQPVGHHSHFEGWDGLGVLS